MSQSNEPRPHAADLREGHEQIVEQLLRDPRLSEEHIDAMLALLSLVDPATGVASCTLEEITERANAIRQARGTRH